MNSGALGDKLETADNLNPVGLRWLFLLRLFVRGIIYSNAKNVLPKL